MFGLYTLPHPWSSEQKLFNDILSGDSLIALCYELLKVIIFFKGHHRFLLPWLRVPCWYFPIWGEKLLAWQGIDPTILDLNSQLSAFDYLTTVTPNIIDG